MSDGTITQQQSDAITNAVDAKLDEKRVEMEARRDEIKAVHEQLKTFLEDDVITQDELDQLPADHPLRTLESALDDGQITLDELRDLRGRVHGHGFGQGGRFGAPGRDGDARGHGSGGARYWLAPDGSDSRSDDEDDSSAEPSPTNR